VKDHAEPAEQNQHLTTINCDTPSELREGDEPTDRPSAAKQQSSIAQEVSKELISTCYTDQNKDHSGNLIKARDCAALVCLEAAATFFQ